ncbi:MAG: ferrous iron transport protein A [Succinivibrio sp.]|nr:ferrous iron transport protein A [Succinivibrio sp.]
MHLNELKPGQSAVVKHVFGEGTALRRRLLDMGITPKTEVKLVRQAPLGDPLQLEVRGYELAMRSSDANLVEVEVQHGH